MKGRSLSMIAIIKQWKCQVWEMEIIGMNFPMSRGRLQDSLLPMVR